MTIRHAAICLTILLAGSALCAGQNALGNASGFDVRNQQPGPQPPLLTAAARSEVVETPNMKGPSVKDPTEDASAEAALLDSVNRSRHKAGAAPLRMDNTLRLAARAHAQLMGANQQLDHNFPGEPSLLQRIANVSPLAIDRAGENIATATCPDDAAEMLFRSPPHRENLLNPQFNVAGIAAVWSHGHLYVVEDFAHEVPSYSARETEKLVGKAIEGMRRSSRLPGLAEVTMPHLDQAACQLATQAQPSARLLAASYTNRKIITYTQSQPAQLPAGASRLLADPNLRQFAIGSCYARNAAYPTGIYWIAILLN